MSIGVEEISMVITKIIQELVIDRARNNSFLVDLQS